MENLYNFDENKLNKKHKGLKIFCGVVIATTIIALIFVCNFTAEYGQIPANKNLSAGDKILYVLFREGMPENIEYNKENSEICLVYDKTIYGTDSDVKIFFSDGKISSLVYVFEEINKDNKYAFSENVINNIENELDDSFTSETDIQNCKAIWNYSEGAKSESIEFFVEEDNASIAIIFQF